MVSLTGLTTSGNSGVDVASTDNISDTNPVAQQAVESMQGSSFAEQQDIPVVQEDFTQVPVEEPLTKYEKFKPLRYEAPKTKVELTPTQEVDFEYQRFQQELVRTSLTNVLNSLGENPDRNIRVNKLSRELNVPVDEVKAKYEDYEKQYLFKNKIIPSMDSSTMVAWASDPNNVATSYDDFGPLSRIAKGISQGFSNDLGGRYDRYKAAFQATLGNPVTELKNREPITSDSLLYTVPKKATEFVSSLGTTVGAGVATGLGTLAVTRNPKTAWTVGTETVNFDQSIMGAGQAASEAYNDAIAQGKTHEEGIVAARVAGGLGFASNYAINKIPLDKGSSLAQKVIRGESLGINSVRAGLVGAGVGAVGSGGSELATNLSSELGLSLVADTTAFNDGEKAYSKFVERPAIAGAFGGVSFGILGSSVPGLAKAYKHYSQSGQRATQVEQQLNDLNTLRQESAQLTRDPDAFNSFLQTALQGSDIPETLHFSRDVMREQINSNPELWARIIPDLDRQIETAVDTGADIKVETSRLMSYAQEDIVSSLISEARATEDSLTANEARNYEAQIPEQVGNRLSDYFDGLLNPTRSKIPELTDKQILFNMLSSKINEANVPSKQTQGLAKLLTEYYTAIDKRNGGENGGIIGEFNRNPLVFQAVDDIAKGNSGRRKTSEIYASDARESSVVLDNNPVQQTLGSEVSKSFVRLGSDNIRTSVRIVDASELKMNSESQSKVINSNLRVPELVRNSDDIRSGSPVIAPDGTIISGNRRFEAISNKYNENGASDYRKSLEKIAKKQGVDIRNMSQPILVRSLESNVDVNRANQVSNRRFRTQRNAVVSDGYSQGAKGRILFEDFVNIVQLFKNSNPSTLIHEFGHKFLEDLLGDVKNADVNNPLHAQLIKDYADVQSWFKDIAAEQLNVLERIYRRDKDEVSLKDITDIRALGGADFLHKMIDEGFTRDDRIGAMSKRILHEGWARAFETYLMNGKAPSKGLRNVFRMFARMLTKIYAGLRDLQVTMSPKITAVFDRLLNAENIAQDVIDDLNLDSAFPSRESMGMTIAEYDAYKEMVNNQAESLREKTINKKMKELQEHRTTRVKEEIKFESDGRMDDLSTKDNFRLLYNFTKDSSPNYRSLLDLNSPSYKLDRDSFVAQFGEELTNKMPKEMFGENGVNYRDAMTIGRYTDEKVFVKDMLEFQMMRESLSGKNKNIHIIDAIRKFIHKEAEQSVHLKLDNPNLRQEAIDSVINGKFNDTMLVELNALSRTLSREIGDVEFPRLDMSSLENFAKGKFNALDLKRAKDISKTFFSAMRRAGDRVQKSLLEGDYLSAYTHKREQLLSSLLYKEALDFERTLKPTAKLIKRIASNKVLRNITPDHNALLHILLQDNGYKTVRSVKETQAGLYESELNNYFYNTQGRPTRDINEVLTSFLSSDDAGSRSDIYFADIVRQGLQGREVSVEYFRELSDTINSIYNNGKNETTIKIGEQKVEYKEAMDAIIYRGYNLKDVSRLERNKYLSINSKGVIRKYLESVVGLAKNFFYSLKNIEGIIDRIVGYDPNSPLVQSFNNLQNGKLEHGKYANRLKEITDEFDKGFGEGISGKKAKMDFYTSLTDNLPNTLLRHYDSIGYGSSVPPLLGMKRIDLIGIFLNYGTNDNLKKLVEGRQKTRDGYDTGWTVDNLEILKDQLTKREWDFIEAHWAWAGELYPAIVKTEKEIRGIAPNKVSERVISTKFGDIQGKYWPLMYEGRREQINEDISSQQRVASGVRERNANVVHPVDINFKRCLDEISKTAYYVHTVAPVRELGKIITDNKFKKMVVETRGEFAYKVLKDWIDDTAAPYRRNIGLSDFYHSLGTKFQAGLSLALFYGVTKPLLDAPAELLTVGMNRHIGVVNSAKAAGWILKEFGKMGVDGFMAFVDGRDVKNGVSEFNKMFDENIYGFKGGPEDIINEIFDKNVKNIPYLSATWKAARDFFKWVLTGFEKITSTLATRGAYEKVQQDMAKEGRYSTDLDYGVEFKNRVNKAIRFTRTPRSKIDQPLLARDKKNGNLKFFTAFALAMLNRVTENIDIMINGGMRNNPTKIQDVFDRLRAGMYLSMMTFISGAAYSNVTGSWWSDKDNADDGWITWGLKNTVMGFAGLTPVWNNIAQALISDNPNAGLYNDMRFDHIQRSVKALKNLQAKGELTDREINNLMMTGSAFGPLAPFQGITNTARYYASEEGQKVLKSKGWYSPEVQKGSRRGYATKKDQKNNQYEPYANIGRQ